MQRHSQTLPRPFVYVVLCTQGTTSDGLDHLLLVDNHVQTPTATHDSTTKCDPALCSIGLIIFSLDYVTRHTLILRN